MKHVRSCYRKCHRVEFYVSFCFAIPSVNSESKTWLDLRLLLRIGFIVGDVRFSSTEAKHESLFEDEREQCASTFRLFKMLFEASVRGTFPGATIVQGIPLLFFYIFPRISFRYHRFLRSVIFRVCEIRC